MLANLSHSRPWFNTLIPRSHESRTPVELRHAWLHSGYTTVDAMLEIGTMSATVWFQLCSRQ